MDGQPEETGAIIDDVGSAADAITESLNKQSEAAPDNLDKVKEPDAEEVELEESSEEEVNEEVNAEPDDEADETSFETISELAEAIDKPLDEFMESIKTTVKINGQTKEVTLSDLRNGYQMESDYRQKTALLSEEKKSFEAEVEQARSDLNSRLSTVDGLIENAEKMYLQEFQGMNWDELEAADREEWLVQRQKFSEKFSQLEQFKSQIGQESGKLQQEAQAKQQESLQAIRQEEFTLLLEKMPNWADETQRNSDISKIASLGAEYGFSESELAEIIDHRTFVVLRDLAYLKQNNMKVDVAKNKIKTLPKLVKPGAKQSSKQIKSKKSGESWSKYEKTGSIQDLGAHIASKLN